VDIYTGKIFIDNTEIHSVSPETIRDILIAGPQDPFLLTGSVRNNADLSGASDDEEIISVLNQIGILEAIQSRGGLDVVLEDHPLS
jgi:ATP-binding cassette, subfamily C (CFTR/MRP), member 1